MVVLLIIVVAMIELDVLTVVLFDVKINSVLAERVFVLVAMRVNVIVREVNRVVVVTEPR